eukprot:TRINITY_DN4814_c0_g1_i1.p1 TRINITY_DN4814_c0_g1~~TRINITY_DN4814_c0_g1_i1.p1  ORF type:complete len:1139 (+),score=298.83 TRINITY_DN4814_c0_g1_i1:121-3537(+)
MPGAMPPVPPPLAGTYTGLPGVAGRNHELPEDVRDCLRLFKDRQEKDAEAITALRRELRMMQHQNRFWQQTLRPPGAASGEAASRSSSFSPRKGCQTPASELGTCDSQDLTYFNAAVELPSKAEILSLTEGCTAAAEKLQSLRTDLDFVVTRLDGVEAACRDIRRSSQDASCTPNSQEQLKGDLRLESRRALAEVQASLQARIEHIESDMRSKINADVQAACRDHLRRSSQETASAVAPETQEQLATELRLEYRRALTEVQSSLQARIEQVELDMRSKISADVQDLSRRIAGVSTQQMELTEISKGLTDMADGKLAGMQRVHQEAVRQLELLECKFAETRQDNVSEIVSLRGRLEAALSDRDQQMAKVAATQASYEASQRRHSLAVAEVCKKLDAAASTVVEAAASSPKKAEVPEADDNEAAEDPDPEESPSSVAAASALADLAELRSALAETCCGLAQLARDFAQTREEHAAAITNVGDLTELVALAARSTEKRCADLEMELEKTAAVVAISKDASGAVSTAGSVGSVPLSAPACGHQTTEDSCTPEASVVLGKSLFMDSTKRTEPISPMSMSAYRTPQEKGQLWLEVSLCVDEAAARIRDEVQLRMGRVETRMDDVEQKVSLQLSRHAEQVVGGLRRLLPAGADKTLSAAKAEHPETQASQISPVSTSASDTVASTSREDQRSSVAPKSQPSSSPPSSPAPKRFSRVDAPVQKQPPAAAATPAAAPVGESAAKASVTGVPGSEGAASGEASVLRELAAKTAAIARGSVGDSTNQVAPSLKAKLLDLVRSVHETLGEFQHAPVASATSGDSAAARVSDTGSFVITATPSATGAAAAASASTISTSPPNRLPQQQQQQQQQQQATTPRLASYVSAAPSASKPSQMPSQSPLQGARSMYMTSSTPRAPSPTRQQSVPGGVGQSGVSPLMSLRHGYSATATAAQGDVLPFAGQDMPVVPGRPQSPLPQHRAERCMSPLRSVPERPAAISPRNSVRSALEAACSPLVPPPGAMLLPAGAVGATELWATAPPLAAAMALSPVALSPGRPVRPSDSLVAAAPPGAAGVANPHPAEMSPPLRAVSPLRTPAQAAGLPPAAATGSQMGRQLSPGGFFRSGTSSPGGGVATPARQTPRTPVQHRLR